MHIRLQTLRMVILHNWVLTEENSEEIKDECRHERFDCRQILCIFVTKFNSFTSQNQIYQFFLYLVVSNIILFLYVTCF